MTVSRRHLLRAAAIVAVGTAGAGTAMWRRPRGLGPALSGNFTDVEAVASIGRWWLAEPEIDRTPEGLWELLHATAGTDPADSAAEVLAGARRQSNEEYEAGMLVEHDGWLLTATQLHVAALVAGEVDADHRRGP